MTAPVRLEAAIATWHQAADIRREWLSWGLRTAPADRAAAEDHLAGIYARLARPRPSFIWVESPWQALECLGGLPDHDELYRWICGRRPAGVPPLASDLAADLSRLRSALDAQLRQQQLKPPKSFRKSGEHPRASGAHLPLDSWPRLPALEAFEIGVPLPEVLRQGVRDALQACLADGFYLPVRGTLAVQARLPVCWYGQQEAWWIAYYDALRRLGLVEYPRAETEHLGEWAALARSCGWWWPGDRRCVVVERPAILRTELVPGTWHEEVRMSYVEYQDGWRVCAGGKLARAQEPGP